MKLLLDTSVFLWLLTGESRLPARVTEAVRDPGNEVRLSVVSFWEILVKHALGRIDLPEAPATYVPRQRQRHRIDPLPLEEAALVHLPKLPKLHRDPFDRMLICQAIEHNLLLVTSDPTIQAYPVRILWT